MSTHPDYRLQVFYARAAPGAMTPRQLAVVWDGARVVDRGTLAAMRAAYPGIVELEDTHIFLSVADLEHFVPSVFDPFGTADDAGEAGDAWHNPG